MSASVSKTIIIGNLGSDPELRFLPDGTPTTTIPVATTSKWKNKTTGEVGERTEWHRVVFFGSLAKVVGDYLKKGSSIYIEGENRTRKWMDSEGVDRYVTEIYAKQMQMLGKKEASDTSKLDAPPSNLPPVDSAWNEDDFPSAE
jgi:single-strand DNA-binding protein